MRKALFAILTLGLVAAARPSFTALSTDQEIKAEGFMEYILVASPYTE